MLKWFCLNDLFMLYRVVISYRTFFFYWTTCPMWDCFYFYILYHILYFNQLCYNVDQLWIQVFSDTGDRVIELLPVKCNIQCIAKTLWVQIQLFLKRFEYLSQPKMLVYQSWFILYSVTNGGLRSIAYYLKKSLLNKLYLYQPYVKISKNM